MCDVLVCVAVTCTRMWRHPLHWTTFHLMYKFFQILNYGRVKYTQYNIAGKRKIYPEFLSRFQRYFQFFRNDFSSEIVTHSNSSGDTSASYWRRFTQNLPPNVFFSYAVDFVFACQISSSMNQFYAFHTAIYLTDAVLLKSIYFVTFG